MSIKCNYAGYLDEVACNNCSYLDNIHYRDGVTLVLSESNQQIIQIPMTTRRSFEMFLLAILLLLL